MALKISSKLTGIWCFILSILVVTPALAQPSNDNCINAIYVCPRVALAANNIGATASCLVADGDCGTSASGGCYVINNSVWFYFTTNAVGGYAEVAVSGITAGVSLQGNILQNAGTCDEAVYSSVACNTGSAGAFILSYNGFAPNTQYYIHIDGVTNTDMGSFQLLISGTAVDIEGDVTVKNDICDNKTGEINVKSLNGLTAPFEYALNGGAYQTSSIFKSLTAGNYVVTVKDSKGCKWDLPVETVKDAKINNVYINNISAVCNASFGKLVVDSVKDGTRPFKYAIDGGAYSSDSVFRNVTVGFHEVSVKDQNLCTFTRTVEVKGENPIECSAGPDQQIVPGTRAEMETRFTGDNNKFTWVPAEGLSSPVASNPYAFPNFTTLYLFTVTTPEGCTCKDEVLVNVANPLEIPNTFSPNGDGVNDVWRIKNLEFFSNCEVSVFNRWGQRVFHSNGYPLGGEWDGKFLGTNLPVATYYYVITLAGDIPGFIPEYTGSITIVR